ncbi:MAG: peptidase inhibitor family I36 protein [Acidimicrobiia bacterium]
MRRTMTTTALVFALILSALPAYAHNSNGPGVSYPAPSGCASGALCVYDGHQFLGNKFQFFGTNNSWGAWAINNNDESAYNNGTSGLDVRVYDLTSYSGQLQYCLRKGRGYKFLDSTLGADHDDDGSSNIWGNYC